MKKQNLKAIFIVLIALSLIFLISKTKKQNLSNPQTQKQVQTQNNNKHINLNSLCSSLPIEQIDKVMNQKHTDLKDGANISNDSGQILNYYCDISYPDNEIAITYENGNFSKHKEALKVLDIGFTEIKLKHDAVIKQSNNGASFEIDDSHYLGINLKNAISQEKLKNLVSVLDKSF